MYLEYPTPKNLNDWELAEHLELITSLFKLQPSKQELANPLVYNEVTEIVNQPPIGTKKEQ